MRANFTLKDLIAVEHDGRYFDLHNCFDFHKMEFSVNDAELTLHWIGSSCENTEEIEELAIAHRKVSYLKILPSDKDAYPGDETCLGEIGLIPSDQRERDDEYSIVEVPGEGYDIVYYFQDGRVIRVKCEEVFLLR